MDWLVQEGWKVFDKLPGRPMPRRVPREAAVVHFATHDVPSHEGRGEAIREILRTLSYGGLLATSDLTSARLYADELRKPALHLAPFMLPF